MNLRVALATVMVTGTVGVTALGLSTQVGYPLEAGPVSAGTALTHRLTPPAPHTSWVAQVSAEKVCAKITDDVSWETCLTSSYTKATNYKLSDVEYVTNGVKGTWKVAWSHVTLPSGGSAINKKSKAQIGVPASVYCKVYTVGDGGQVILCNNGSRH
jgi:hypothetical protein